MSAYKPGNVPAPVRSRAHIRRQSEPDIDILDSKALSAAKFEGSAAAGAGAGAGGSSFVTPTKTKLNPVSTSLHSPGTDLFAGIGSAPATAAAAGGDGKTSADPLAILNPFIPAPINVNAGAAKGSAVPAFAYPLSPVGRPHPAGANTNPFATPATPSGGLNVDPFAAPPVTPHAGVNPFANMGGPLSPTSTDPFAAFAAEKASTAASAAAGSNAPPPPTPTRMTSDAFDSFFEKKTSAPVAVALAGAPAASAPVTANTTNTTTTAAAVAVSSAPRPSLVAAHSSDAAASTTAAPAGGIAAPASTGGARGKRAGSIAAARPRVSISATGAAAAAILAAGATGTASASASTTTPTAPAATATAAPAAATAVSSLQDMFAGAKPVAAPGSNSGLTISTKDNAARATIPVIDPSAPAAAGSVKVLSVAEKAQMALAHPFAASPHHGRRASLPGDVTTSASAAGTAMTPKSRIHAEMDRMKNMSMRRQAAVTDTVPSAGASGVELNRAETKKLDTTFGSASFGTLAGVTASPVQPSAVAQAKAQPAKPISVPPMGVPIAAATATAAPGSNKGATAAAGASAGGAKRPSIQTRAPLNTEEEDAEQARRIAMMKSAGRRQSDMPVHESSKPVSGLQPTAPAAAAAAAEHMARGHVFEATVADGDEEEFGDDLIVTANTPRKSAPKPLKPKKPKPEADPNAAMTGPSSATKSPESAGAHKPSIAVFPPHTTIPRFGRHTLLLGAHSAALPSTMIDALPILKAGTPFLKYGRFGAPHFRVMRLSDDHRKIGYFSKKKAEEVIVGLDDVETVRLGQTTPAFMFNDAPRELALASFSIVYDEFKGKKGKGQLTCLDFVATEVRDFEVWTQAVRLLAAMANRRVDLSKISALPVEVSVVDAKSAGTGSGMTHYHDLIAAKVGPLAKLGYLSPSFAAADLLYAHPPALAHAVAAPERTGRRIDALPFLLGGSYLIKFAAHSSGGPADFRKFFVSAARDVIYWQSQSANKTVYDSRIDLDEIDDIYFGQSTPAFTTHDAPRELAPLSFSIIYAGRTKSLDLIAPTPDEFEAWTEGILQLQKISKQTAAAAATAAGTAAAPTTTAAVAAGGVTLKDVKQLVLTFPNVEADDTREHNFRRAFGAVPRP